MMNKTFSLSRSVFHMQGFLPILCGLQVSVYDVYDNYKRLPIDACLLKMEREQKKKIINI